MNQALGLIEAGHLAAIVAADTALKTSNVTLLGMENSMFDGMLTVKLEGDISAVKEAVKAGAAAALRVDRVHRAVVIPKPGLNLDRIMIRKVSLPCVTSNSGSGTVKEPMEDDASEVVPEPKESYDPEAALELLKDGEPESVPELPELPEDGEPESVPELPEDGELEMVPGSKESDKPESVPELPEGDKPEIAPEPKKNDKPEAEIKEEVFSCNLCHDPECPRVNCIHYNKKKEA